MRARLLAVAHTLHSELKVARQLLKDPRTPGLARIFLGLAVAYGLLPFDLIPDWVPILGLLDDLALVPGLIALAFKLTPQAALDEARRTQREVP